MVYYIIDIYYFNKIASTVFKHLDDIAHTIILVLDAFIKYAIHCKSDIRGHIGCMIFKLDVRDLFFGNLAVANLNYLTRISSECVGVRSYRLSVNRNAVKCFVCGSIVTI